jgi:hypothetical protein
MMNALKSHILSSILLVIVVSQGCREHEIVDPLNEQELITTITLSLQQLNEQGEPAGELLTYSWRDEDGSGNPVIDQVILNSGSRYLLEMEILDESKTPVGSITEEIIEEGSEHQFFYEVSGPSMSFEYDDEDENGKPIGLRSIVDVGQAGVGTLTVVLRHAPEKDAPGVTEGDIANAGGETDIEAVFPLSVVE